nr:DUF3320 domain-containing protein [uncultured Flavobacterium sp.]
MLRCYNHNILQSLFDTGFNEPQPSIGEEHHLDNDTNADELMQVVDADSSQVIAMLAVHEGRNMVIQGPPGTGKSQTITNLIANAVGNGKKVLFVAEKMAALEVVKRRLDSVNLGEACLELHSHKANKRELHNELKRILDLGRPTMTRLEEEIRFLHPMINELNQYCTSVNSEISKSGYSAQEVMGNLLKITTHNKDYKFPKIQVENISVWDSIKIKEVEQLAEKIQVRLEKIGQPENLLFYGTDIKIFLPIDEETSKELLEIVIKDTNEVITLITSISNYVEINPSTEIDDVKLLLKTIKTASENPGLTSMNITDSAWLNNEADIAELLETGIRLEELHTQYDNLVIPEAWDYDLLEIRQNLIVHGSKWYKFLIGDYKNSVKKLSALLTIPVPSDLNTKLEYVNALMEGKRLTASLLSLEPLAQKLFDIRYQKKRTDWKTVKKAVQYLQEVHLLIQDDIISNTFLSFLSKNQESSVAGDFLINLENALKKQNISLKSLLGKLDLKDNQILNTSLAKQQSLIKNWFENLPEIHQAVSWNVMKEEIERNGADYLIRAVYNWPDAVLHLKTAVQKTWYEHLIEQAMTNSVELRKFERSSHEEVIEKFKRLDVLNQFYNRAKVALKHWESLPKQEGGGQINVLKSEFNRKARHMPIRKLMQEAGLAIQAIKPVIMMSPMSIANFLPPNSIDFDLVIFDEASQVRPVDALGAILRGRQIVVVGDTKQMPPTSFFDKLNTDTEDEENVTADMQSILGMCDAQGAPQRMLRWHYRSRHESLINLSNQEFYENKLIIFPSPGSKSKMGLAFNHLPDTYYDKGKTRTNPKEAEKVADAIINHAINNPKLSLGVVAFSTAQMQAIQNALEVKRRKNPEVESFFRSHPTEPLFIKNLENVQGDERDVIFISIGYGRTEDGKVPMSFGPLNNEGGERRLNVLITRAKSRCEVFTNITASDMNPGPNAKFGIRALKSFLYYAQHGKFESDKEEIITKPQPFEEIITQSLRDNGYIVREKVGSAGFYIDLAIVDNDNPGRYILGICCDGKSYETAKSARDRDRLRTIVLEGMGWKLFNVWSTDWFRNPQRELRLLIETIENAKNQVEHNDALEEELMEDLKNLVREEPEEIDNSIPHYIKASLPIEVCHQEIHTYSLGKLGAWIHDVVKVESPVHFEEMARRIADANGISKIGSRVRASITDAVNYAVRAGLIKEKDDFLWHFEDHLPVIRDRSLLTPNSKKLNLISDEEMNLAIIKVVESSIAIQPDNAVILIAKLFGFARVTEDMRNHILQSIKKTVKSEIVKKDGEFLKIIKD